MWGDSKLAVVAIAVLLLADQAWARSAETACQNAKLTAASQYYDCVTRAVNLTAAGEREVVEDKVTRCDRPFETAFEQAEAAGGCRTPGGSSPVREAIKAQVRTNASTISATPVCASLKVAGGVAICQPSKSGSAIDLDGLLDELSTEGVNDATVIWIQAWGGDGGFGNNENAGAGAPGGYAQLTTTVGAIKDNFGQKTLLHYYLGKTGSNTTTTGGDGGTSSLVTVSDLTSEELDIADTLLIAAGGGGGGGGRGSQKACGASDVNGYNGGGGAVAISVIDADSETTIVSGNDGQFRTGGAPDSSGQGGGDGGNGGAPGKKGSGQAGDDALAPIGGAGGSHETPQVGFFNQAGTKVTRHGGDGGGPGDDAGGGGGGGGYSGGGGGSQGTAKTDCTAGGGGGGSSFAAAPKAFCSAAPTAKPPNPNGKAGFVQIVVDVGACN